MPIEIRELVIRTVVGGASAQQPAEDADHPQGARLPAGADIDQLVQECVRQVLRVLARERER